MPKDEIFSFASFTLSLAIKSASPTKLHILMVSLLMRLVKPNAPNISCFTYLLKKEE